MIWECTHQTSHFLPLICCFFCAFSACFSVTFSFFAGLSAGFSATFSFLAGFSAGFSATFSFLAGLSAGFYVCFSITFYEGFSMGFYESFSTISTVDFSLCTDFSFFEGAWAYQFNVFNCAFITYWSLKSFLSSIIESLISWEGVFDLQLLEPVTLLFFFLQEAQDTGFALLGGLFLGFIVLLGAEHISCGNKLPITVPVLERFLVGTLQNVYIKLSAEDQIVVHGFSSNFSNFTLGKL